MSMMGSSLKASLFKKSCGGHWPHDSQGHQRGCGQRPGRSLGRVNGVDTNAAFMGKKMDIYQNHPKPMELNPRNPCIYFLSNPDGHGVDEAGQRIRIGNEVSIDPLNWS